MNDSNNGPLKTATHQYPPMYVSGYVLTLLLIAYIFSFIDRNIMAMLIGPIRTTFDISDFQFSLLHGVAFTIFYITLGLPIGRLADRQRRTWIIASGVFVWSVMTCLCGFAKGFASLFMARMGVGVGEATLSPATYSLLPDLFPPDKLRWATSIFAMGIPLGGGLAYIIGGNVYEYIALGNNLPGLAALNAWQQTFVAVGSPGIIIALLIVLISEPNRRVSASAVTTSDPDKSIPVKDIIQHLRAHKYSYATIFVTVSLMSVIGYGTANWFPEFLQRIHGLSRVDTGNRLGLLSIVAGTAGMFMGAASATWLQRRGHTDANLRVVGISTALLIVPAPLATLLPDVDMTIALWWFVVFIHYGYFGISMAAMLAITPSGMHAQIAALLLFFANLFGLILGTTIVAMITDFVFHDDSALHYSLSIVTGVLYPICAVVVFAGLKHYRHSLEQM